MEKVPLMEEDICGGLEIFSWDKMNAADHI